jgi:hypothetical protein
MESPVALSPGFRQLWDRLRGHGHLWHRTPIPSFERILHDQKIVPNIGQLPVTFGQSKVSYAWHLNAVSLFDFDTADERVIFGRCEWESVLLNASHAGVLIRIRRDALDRTKLLLPTEIAHGDSRLDPLRDDIRQGRMFLPEVEALHIGPISSSAFSGFILVASAPTGGYLHHEAEVTAGVFRLLSEINAGWNTEHERRTAQRHARGEYTLEELVLASQDSAPTAPTS